MYRRPPISTLLLLFFSFFFFFNDTGTTEIYTLSLHDALPICLRSLARPARSPKHWKPSPVSLDRKSTRLNSSHGSISYAVFCLQKKNKPHNTTHRSTHYSVFRQPQRQSSLD